MKILNKKTCHKNYNKSMDKENISPTEEAYYTTTLPSLLSLSTKKQVGKLKSTIETKISKKKNNNNGLSHISENKMNQMMIITNKEKKEESSLLINYNVVSPPNIDSISRRLKDNMTKVTYKMMACLSQSNQPLYEKLFESSIIASHSLIVSNQDNNDSNLAILIDTVNNNNNVSFMQEQQEDVFSALNKSFDIEQENEFINTWLQQYDTGGACGSAGYYYDSLLSNSLDEYDAFSIVTDQELSELLSQDEAFNTNV